MGTNSQKSWVSRFTGSKSTVYLAGADALIYAHTKQGVTPQNAKKYIATFRNSVSNAFRTRNDGRVEVGAKRKGYLYVSGNAYIAGSLKTTHKGKKVNMMEELDRVKEENSAMKRMLSEMQAQNAALLRECRPWKHRSSCTQELPRCRVGMCLSAVSTAVL